MSTFPRRTAALAVLLALSAAPIPAQQKPSSSARTHVQTLASAAFEGREAGTNGERRAGDYIAAQLARIGARPLPGRDNMFVPFAFTAGSRDGGSRVAVQGTAGSSRTFADAADVLALSFSDDGDIAGEVVFAGYGIVVPESQTFGYVSYAGLDVKDKVALVLRYFPEDADQATRAILARYSDLRYKALAVRQRGARGGSVGT